MAVNVRKDILWRIYLTYLFILVLAGFVIFQLAKIQFVEGDHWRSRAQALTLRYANIEALRGNIFDVNGQLLATSLPYFDVAVDLNTEPISDELFEDNIDSLAICLSGLFKDRTAGEYKKFLARTRNSGDRYVMLHSNVSYKDLQQLKSFPLFRRGRFKGGLIYTQKGRRELPFQFLAARTIGYSREGALPVGLEGAYNKELTGVSGKRLVRRIAGGIEVPVNDENEIEPQDGCDLISTIDINIQDVAENALLEQLIKHKAGWGCVILMEVRTGEIRAMANLSRRDSSVYAERYNYAIGHRTEPGSTFKLASLMAGMEDGYFDLNDTIETGHGVLKVYSQTVKDSRHGGYGRMSVQEVFEKSSNVGTVKLIQKYYGSNPKKFIDRLYKMGVNLNPELSISGGAAPDVKSLDDRRWSKVSLPWMSFGYELRLTPLQILTFYNAVANNGAMMKPVFVKEIRKQGKIIKRVQPEVIHPQIASAATIAKAKQMMEGVVQRGTATNLKHADYLIAGKTGTAQIAKVGGKGGYGQKSRSVTYQASFAGYFPADNPKYSCIVVVNAPSDGVYYGNAVAGPIFKEIADKVYSTLQDIHSEVSDQPLAYANLPQIKAGQKDEVRKVVQDIGIATLPFSGNGEYVRVSHLNDSTLSVDNFSIQNELVNNRIPDVTGMGLKDALYLLENAGLQVVVIGSGSIYEQSLKPGTEMHPGSSITIYLH